MGRYGRGVVYDFGTTMDSPVGQWQLLTQFPYPELDPELGNYVVMIWGVVGNVALNGQTLGQCELELRINTNQPISPPVRLWGPYVNHVNGLNRGSSFCLIQKVAFAPGTQPLSLYGRYASPIPSQGSPTFRVEPLSWMVVDLDEIGANKWAYQEYAPGPSGFDLPFLGSPPAQLATLTLPWQASSESWLCFFTTQVAPGSDFLPYNTFMAHLPDGTWGSATDYAGLTQHGTVARGPVDVSGATLRVHTGLFRRYVATSANDAIGLGGINIYNSGFSPYPSRVYGGRLFAINVDNDIGFSVTTLQPGWAFYGETPTRHQQTLAMGEGARVTALACAVPDVVNTTGKSFAGYVEQGANKAGALVPLHVYETNTFDSMPEWVSGEILARQGSNYLRWYGLRNPVEGSGAPVPFWFSKYWYGVTLALKTTAGIGGYGNETPGPVVVIRPGKEALGLGSLTALPLEPSFSLPAEQSIETSALKTISGHVVAWPRFLVPRQRWSLRWALSRADRDTLQAFFAGLDAQTFKWTPPNGVESAFVLVGDAVEEEDLGSGKAYSVTAQVLRLVYIG